MLDGAAVDQHVQHLLPAGDIKEGDPDEDGEQPLAGKKQHHETGETEKSPQAVSDHLDHEGQGGMALVSLFHNAGMGEEITGGSPGDQKGNEQQADQKGGRR